MFLKIMVSVCGFVWFIFFNYFCMVESLLCFLFVWLLADGLNTAVSVWWLHVLIFFCFFKHWTWTRENTIRWDEGCLVYNGIHSVLMGPCVTYAGSLHRWATQPFVSLIKRSRSTRKNKTFKRLWMIRSLFDVLNSVLFFCVPSSVIMYLFNFAKIQD